MAKLCTDIISVAGNHNGRMRIIFRRNVMVSMNLNSRLFCALFLVALFFSAVNSVSAQSSAGIGISPATIEGPANPGEVKEYKVDVSNLSNTEQTIYLSKKDIVDVRGNGVPVFANEGAEKTGYELTEWVSLPIDQMTLPPNSTQQMEFTLAVPADATPGSHFGGIFLSVQPPRLRESGAAIGYEVANIISIRVAGDAVENAQLRSFSTDNYIYGKSEIEFTANIRNQGNVLVRPIGPLEIYNMFGEQVATLTFNEREGGVFPGRDREFTITWSDEGPGFGRYQAVLSLSYGSDGQKSTIFSTVSFWILPMNIIGPALAVLVVLLLVTYFGIRTYIRRSLAMYGAGARRIVRQRQRRGTSMPLLIAIVMLVVTTLFLIILLLLFA